MTTVSYESNYFINWEVDEYSEKFDLDLIEILKTKNICELRYIVEKCSSNAHPHLLRLSKEQLHEIIIREGLM